MLLHYLEKLKIQILCTVNACNVAGQGHKGSTTNAAISSNLLLQ